ncbi:hypothetical protein AMTRI_Chr10g2080 [Amborella trichopoda]
MALSIGPISHSLPLTRLQTGQPLCITSNLLKLQEIRLQRNWCLRAVCSKKNAEEFGENNSMTEEQAAVEKPSSGSKREPRGPRRKAKEVDSLEEAQSPVTSNAQLEESTVSMTSAEDPPKISSRGRKKKASPSTTSEKESTTKKVGRRRKSKEVLNETEDESKNNEDSKDLEKPISTESGSESKDSDLERKEDEDEDASITYDWPPLVCCFGPAKYSFIPSGRPANRLVDYDMHESRKGLIWTPTKFVRAPGTSSYHVALALASLGGKVAYMGKLGDDDYGHSLLYHLNLHNVQTRSVRIDGKRATALSYMKLSKRGGKLRLTCARPGSEDCFSSSEINVDVLKEAKMFYFNSSSLVDQEMRSTTMEAIDLLKKLGGVVFFDLNLPLPLWKSKEETRTLIEQAWKQADFVEVTKQELEFLCGIEPSEKFDTKDNDKSKFIHHKREVISPLWHESLKVLFVTNGTSKIHYYMEKTDGAENGMEDAPISPFTCDMSTSGDAIVAALMRMLVLQPDLCTDRGYLRHAVKYAINCGVHHQWLIGRIRGFPPKEESLEPPYESHGFSSITEKEYRTIERDPEMKFRTRPPELEEEFHTEEPETESEPELEPEPIRS